jgi:hypothetical protein
MADIPDPKPDPDAKPDPDPDNKPDLGDAGKKALDAERKSRRDAEKALADLQTKLKDLEDKDTSEVDKMRDDVANLTKERDDAAVKALRMEIATEKGIAKHKYVTGTTREEMEAAADEYLEDHPASVAGTDGEKRDTPGGRPKERLRGGGDPTDEPEETDPRKLADLIPRN